MKHYDVAVVGAGMAGASVAALLAPDLSVVLLEMESQPGYHSTGRSAAFWSETYGGPLVHPLTSASFGWLADGGFLSPRGEINIARAEDDSALKAFGRGFEASNVPLIALDHAGISAHCDFIGEDWNLGLAVPSCQDIDVAGVHQRYLAIARAGGVDLRCNARLHSARRSNGKWQVDVGTESVTADVVVNAAGAWADDVAKRAGVSAIGISPFRRTMVQVRLDRDVPRSLPLIIDVVHGTFYFKSDGAGGLWLSPHDEVPSVPADAAPEELDVAIAIDRFEKACVATVRSVTHKWAGLRSFAPDRLPVYGFDAHIPGFFWFAGQGGFGIQTAPAAAMVAQALIAKGSPDPAIAAIDLERYAPGRFT